MHRSRRCRCFDAVARIGGEQALVTSGVDWAILRMSVLTDALSGPTALAAATGVYETIGAAPAAYVTWDDIAATAAGITTTSGHVGVTYQAAGPATLEGIIEFWSNLRDGVFDL